MGVLGGFGGGLRVATVKAPADCVLGVCGEHRHRVGRGALAAIVTLVCSGSTGALVGTVAVAIALLVLLERHRRPAVVAGVIAISPGAPRGRPHGRSTPTLTSLTFDVDHPA